MIDQHMIKLILIFLNVYNFLIIYHYHGNQTVKIIKRNRLKIKIQVILLQIYPEFLRTIIPTEEVIIATSISGNSLYEFISSNS